MTESRKQKAESRKQKAERIVITVDLSVNNTNVITVANCITAREDRGISNIQRIGNGVVMEIIEE